MRSSIVSRAIDPAALAAEVALHEHGAVVMFVGTVRNTSDGRAVDGMEYAAYGAMAEQELARILGEARERYPAANVIVEHRTGRLALGEASVAIAVAHAHRGPAYEASRYVIEELKKRLPVWKREEYSDGTREWVDPTRAPAKAST